MSILDIFKFKEIKKENERLLNELNQMQKFLTPEMLEVGKLEKHVQELRNIESSIIGNITNANATLYQVQTMITEKQKMLVDMDEEILYQNFALYKPKYDMVKSEEYKLRLDKIRDLQKMLIKNNQAVTGNMNWAVNGSLSEGKKMVKDTQKLLLRAFNCECDDVINHVTYANIKLSEKRLQTTCAEITKLGRIMNIAITYQYFQSKIEELYLVFEYKQKKQAEKEEEKERRAQMREEMKLQKEIEESRKKMEKEKQHYENALDSINRLLQHAKPEQITDLEEKKTEMESHLIEINQNLKDIDYREANVKAGYVYIISNIGAFGENVYKIGMTRRLDPQERIDELGDASVPFKFDIHAMIFSDNAPALEASLHRAFENKKLNMVNQRREFFNVTLEEIKEVVRNNFDRSVEFIEIPEAEQYRASLKIKDSTMSRNRDC